MSVPSSAFQRNRAGRDRAPEGRERVDRPGIPLGLRKSLSLFPRELDNSGSVRTEERSTISHLEKTSGCHILGTESVPHGARAFSWPGDVNVEVTTLGYLP